MDDQLRSVERRALSGDPSAQEKLLHLQDRISPLLTSEELKSQINAHLHNFKQQAERSLHRYIKNFLSNHREVIESFSWTQYTPYWEDGSPTEFYYTPFLEYGTENVGFTDKYQHHYELGTPLSDKDKKSFDEAYKELEKIDSTLGSLEHILEIVFGDHVEVTATENGFTKCEFKHHH